jgi:hypothetical protein
MIMATGWAVHSAVPDDARNLRAVTDYRELLAGHQKAIG